jgi:hypothetical protein
MTEIEYVQTLDDLNRLLNDPDVPMQPALIWRLLDEVSEQDGQGTMLSRLMASDHDMGHANVQRPVT